MDPNARQWSPLTKFVWAVFLVGIFAYTGWWKPALIFGVSATAVMVMWALVKRGGGQVKSAPRERAAMRHTVNGWERETR